MILLKPKPLRLKGKPVLAYAEWAGPRAPIYIIAYQGGWAVAVTNPKTKKLLLTNRIDQIAHDHLVSMRPPPEFSLQEMTPDAYRPGFVDVNIEPVAEEPPPPKRAKRKKGKARAWRPFTAHVQLDPSQAVLDFNTGSRRL